MEYTYPEYLYDFQCEASACSDTCCEGWGIAIDSVSLKKYRKYPGFFGNRLRNSIDWEKEAFEQYNGRCAFLNEENLCDIYKEEILRIRIFHPSFSFPYFFILLFSENYQDMSS